MIRICEDSVNARLIPISCFSFQLLSLLGLKVLATEEHWMVRDKGLFLRPVCFDTVMKLDQASHNHI